MAIKKIKGLKKFKGKKPASKIQAIKAQTGAGRLRAVEKPPDLSPEAKDSSPSSPVHGDVIRRFSKEKALELYQKLVKKKAEVQNRPQLSKQALSSLGSERGGEDQADLMSRLQAETQYMVQIQRDSSLINQVLKALTKMQSGEYGICEQTGEVIEIERLDSIPWTALSIEGAEDLENMERLRRIR